MGGQGKVVTEGKSGVAPVSLRAYARHRGVRLSAVQKAIASGRLVVSVVKKRGAPLKIVSLAAADQEWDANTNATKAAPSVIAKELKRAAAEPPPPAATPASQVPTSTDEDEKPMSFLEASAIEKKWKGKSEELKYRELAGQLVNAAQVESRIVETFTRCRTKLLGVPGKVKTAIPSLTRANIVTIEMLIREALEDLVEAEAPEQGAA